VSDEYLEKLYSASSCLIAASYGEGFGLPLIEAAHHGLPVLARDLAVFREVANDNATYFTANDSQDLADAILQWLQNPSQRNLVTPGSAMTWQQSVAQLNQALWLANEKNEHVDDQAR